jgi:LysM repeat protein
MFRNALPFGRWCTRGAMCPVVCVLAATCLSGCVRATQEVIVITATFPPPTESIELPTTTREPAIAVLATLAPAEVPVAANSESQAAYAVQPGDTLSSIALAHNVSLQALLALNALVDPDRIEVGQIIQIPAPPATVGSDAFLLPNSKLVRAPGSDAFDVAAFIRDAGGYAARATDEVDEITYSAAQIVERVSLEFSVDPRLLLALLEYRTRFLSASEVPDAVRDYPLQIPQQPFSFDRKGLYLQLTFAADRLNRGYYGWQSRGLNQLEFTDGTRIRIADTLNAGTVGVQFLFSQFGDYAAWAGDVAADGFIATYTALFGPPQENAIDPLVPPDLVQPELGLPFSRGQTWYFTGGPHGGWGSGSAWAAIDFAPPDDLTNVTSSCYLSEYEVTAVAPGRIVRSRDGVVVQDLDGDGDELTGWSILYLHIDDRGRIAADTEVQTGDVIGYASCQGGFSTGTHMHLARRYNGEWIPADCQQCRADAPRPPFVLDGWQAYGLPNQEYQGFLLRDGLRVVAEQGRNVANNEISW